MTRFHMIFAFLLWSGTEPTLSPRWAGLWAPQEQGFFFCFADKFPGSRKDCPWVLGNPLKKKKKEVRDACWMNKSATIKQVEGRQMDYWNPHHLWAQHWTSSPELEVVSWPLGHSLCDLKPHLPLQALDYPPSSWLHLWGPIWFQWE